MILKYIIRWKDRDGNEYRREYTDEAEALKAQKWLNDNGARTVDFAVQVD